MTKIEFTDEHLRVMMTALEVYSRLRMGQIGIAMDEAFRDFCLSWDERESIEKFIREMFSKHAHVRLRPNFPLNGYFGVGHEKMNKSGGTLAYEIYSTLRQYDALRRNDGYEGNTVDFRDPLELTGTPLPKIEGFSAEKAFPIKGKAVLGKIKKAKESQDYGKMWGIIGEYLARHYPELEGYSQARIEEEGNHLVVITKGARKKNDEQTKMA